jgi:glycosyltransferase involved in cell wall biosynthesis
LSGADSTTSSPEPDTDIAGRMPAAERRKPVVLVLMGYYPPAFLAGGPTRSVPRIVEQLGDELDFRVVTRNRDLGVPAPLPGIEPNRWLDRDGARCLYVPSGPGLIPRVLAAIARTRHDVLYVNSLFSLSFSLLPLGLRRLRLLPRRRLIVAPRGELDPSALAIKATRKRWVLRLARGLGLLNDAVWHAATPGEAGAIRREFGSGVRVLVARDIPLRADAPAAAPPKEPGGLELVFLGRIAKMKNLDFALSVLQAVRGRVRLTVYGPVEDEAYWEACRRLAEGLPTDVTMDYRGVVDPDGVTAALARHHVFFLPSRGESFGHAIVEAMSAGCPVLISDRTPWRDLERRHAGWDVPLGQTDRYVEVLERCVGMTSSELDAWSAGARAFAREVADDPALDDAYRQLFRAAVGALIQPARAGQ